MKLYLSNILDNDYTLDQNIIGWNNFDIKTFSKNKNLYDYQIVALNRIIKVLHMAFNNNSQNFNELANKYNEFGLDFEKEFSNTLINRISMWMATGSGKSIVLLKTIELINWSMNRNLIPKRKIMLLLPREDLISQFEKEIEEYNLNRNYEDHINLINLKKYETNERNYVLFNGIQVYYYRSDLLRDERKETILDYKDYLNNGEWYILLDEAHRGQDNEDDKSKMKQHLSKLAEKGFLFNFSATFTENIDFATCAFNFNLEKFISEGYGKNIYLSDSLLEFNKKNSQELLIDDKQKQILKSIIVFSLIKKFKMKNTYHNPLMVTYVNSVNVEEADLKLFFNEIVKIAVGRIDTSLFNDAKQEIINELGKLGGSNYVFDKEELILDQKHIDFLIKLDQQEILELFFNSKTHSNIEWQKGENGKEVALKLTSSDKYFALIRIGDVDAFISSMLSKNYIENGTFHKENMFEKLNDPNNDINLLMGSRSFYEGWDSNRPNVINLINIGGSEAKKFVPQALGRGIRIQPDISNFTNRKRLPIGNINKNQLLETLFVFATDKKSLSSILEEIDRSSNRSGKFIEKNIGDIFQTNIPSFDLLIPVYKKKKDNVFSKFSISTNSCNKLKQFLYDTSKLNILLNYNINEEEYDLFISAVKSGELFHIDESKNYLSITRLLSTLVEHIKNYEKEVQEIKKLEHEISHFKNISIIIGENIKEKEAEELEIKIRKNIKNEPFDQFIKKPPYKNLKLEEQEILYENLKGKNPDSFLNSLVIENFKNHYYTSVLFTEDEKMTYIKHIVKTSSESIFLRNLSNYLSKNQINYNWAFSKINEHIDKGLGMPYFSKEKNAFSNFYPDFIFWLDKRNSYEIVFVDPKGTKSTSWESKVDYFIKLFEEDNKPKPFRYNNKNIVFKLRLLTDDLNKLDGEAYKKYWFSNDDFSFLK